MSEPVAVEELFERRLAYPDIDSRMRFSRLIGLDEQKSRLTKVIGTLVNPDGLEKWAKKHHPDAGPAIDLLLRRPPLVILAGDVGSGKTELAETVGDAVARQEDVAITLFPLSLAARGQGRVGEMTRLITAAFEHAAREGSKLKSSSGRTRGAVILLVDEADALAQSREAAQMHHEDRAGVNAFIRGIDRLANAGLPVAVIMCTNRLGSLDPAVRRRAADILSFERPSPEQRLAVLGQPLAAVGLSAADVQRIVAVTGPSTDRDYGFTFSDLTQRLVPSIILDAYPVGPVLAKRAMEIAKNMRATPPFQDARP